MKTKEHDNLSSFATRCKSETPKFFKKLRTIGLVVAAVGTTIIASPIALPAVVSTLGGYLILGGTVMTTISQSAVEEDAQK